jgi:DNA invertase Pin-like site-specific DNA recombinase
VSDPKVTAAHRRRSAAIYVRQSTLMQVEHNRESTLRQYDLVERAVALGWPRPAIVVIDADLGVSGSGKVARSGFVSLIEQVALGQIGIVLALEASRLARNNADWYRLLDLAAITDTLITDGDAVYHPGMFDDRLLLGLKGTMSEAELQMLRARMLGGLRSKAARGELRVALPIGLVWGPQEGQILLDSDEAVRGAITAVFEQFAVGGSVRGVWLWRREQGGCQMVVVTGSPIGSEGSRRADDVVIVKADAVPSGVSVPEGTRAEVARLVEQAQFDGVQLTGEGGLLLDMIKQAVEAALQGEMTGHLGYERYAAEGRGSGNSRNGSTAKKATLNIQFVDYPGGWIEDSATEEERDFVIRLLRDSDAILIPIDAPALMERRGFWHRERNRPDFIFSLLQEAYEDLKSPRLVVLAPIVAYLTTSSPWRPGLVQSRRDGVVPV